MGTGRYTNRVDASGDGAVGAGRDVYAAATGDGSSATYIERLYVRQSVAPEVGPERGPVSAERVDEALIRYADRVRESYGRLDLEVLIPTEEGDHPAVGLNEVFVAPSVRADPPPAELPRDVLKRLVEKGEWSADRAPWMRREAMERVLRAYSERPPRDALEILAAPGHDRLVLLGDPGAGKSTLARHLALALTGTGGEPSEALAPLAGRVPLIVELREYAAGPWRDSAFEDFLDHLHTTRGMAPPRDVTAQLLGEGRAVVVFDGLDELFEPAAREQVSHRIANFAGRYRSAGVRVVVTSRVIGYKRGVFEHADFRQYMIQELGESQIERFAGQWYATACPQNPERAERLGRSLTEAVTRSRPVRELAGNPLLLTILAIIGRRKELPRDRQGVYRHAMEVLVARWDEHAKYLKEPQDPRFLDWEDRHELLMLVARRMQHGRDGLAGNHIHRNELIETFSEYLRDHYELRPAEAKAAACAMVDRLRERNFILSHYGSGVYGFVHRALLEYLAAEDIALRFMREREWSPQELVEEVFGRHARDSSWHEVLLLLVGQLASNQQAEVIDLLLALHRRRDDDNDAGLLSLSVRALAEVRRIGTLKGRSLSAVTALIEFLEVQEDNDVRFAASGEGVAALAGFAPDWSGAARLLRWFLLRGQTRVVSRSAPDVASSVCHDPDLARLLATTSRDPSVRVSGMRLLADRWGSEATTWRSIHGAAVADSHPQERVAALQLLVEHRGDDESTWELARDRARFDRSAEVRAFAMAVSVRRDGRDYAQWHAIAEQATTSPAELVRRTATELLGEFCGGRADIRELLRHQAVEDRSEGVRRTALEALRRSADHETDTWALLRDRAVADPSPTVRRSALREWSRHLGPDETVWNFLSDRAVTDPALGVAWEAYEAMGRMWGEEPRTWDLLQERAVHTMDSSRLGALAELIRLRGGEQSTRDVLRRLATEDPSPVVRVLALRGFGDRGHDPGDIAELLTDSAVADPLDAPRAEALQALARLAGEDPRTWEVLRTRAVADTEDYPRRVALELLSRYAHAEPSTWDLMRHRAVDDPTPGIRRWALAFLACSGEEDSALREFLRTRAVQDDDIGVRNSALCWYAVHEPGDVGADFVQTWIGEQPVGEHDALHLLAYGWPAHPGTLPLLRAHGHDGLVATAEALARLPHRRF